MAIGKDEILKAVEAMSALELMQVVKAIEDRFGVSAKLVAQPARAEAPEQEDEGALFSVRLVSAGANRVSVVKVIREISGLGLKEAMDILNTGGAIVRRDQEKAAAEGIAARLGAAGAVAEVVKS